MRGRVGEAATRGALVVMGLFTAVPVMALFQPEQLESYGIVDPEPMVLTLLQHRGVFQLLAGAALVWAAFRRDVRLPIAAGVILSKGVALALTFSRPEAQEQANSFIQGFDLACIAVLVVIIATSVAGSRPTVRSSASNLETS